MRSVFDVDIGPEAEPDQSPNFSVKNLSGTNFFQSGELCGSVLTFLEPGLHFNFHLLNGLPLIIVQLTNSVGLEKHVLITLWQIHTFETESLEHEPSQSPTDDRPDKQGSEPRLRLPRLTPSNSRHKNEAY